MNIIRILLVGDVVGEPGRRICEKYIPVLISKYGIDGIILNGENSCQTGRGITLKALDTFKKLGVDVITTGNHIWQQKEIYDSLSTRKDLLRPGNFPVTSPGVGFTVVTTKVSGIKFGVINVQGRVFMREFVSCPFEYLDKVIPVIQEKTSIIFVDLHAEATAEKIGIAHHCTGRVSAVVGTHTHVQTADERILGKHTAFITDLGMVGSQNGMLGMKKEPIIQQMMTQIPVKFAVETLPPYILCGVLVEVDSSTGAAKKIERLLITDEQPC